MTLLLVAVDEIEESTNDQVEEPKEEPATVRPKFIDPDRANTSTSSNVEVL